MKRREFVERFGLGSAVFLAGEAIMKGMGRRAAALEHQHEHEQVNGPLASATVSFGQWMTAPALDRFPNASPREANQHLLVPYVAGIKPRGSVNFIISGFHHVLIYEPGTQLGDIDTTLLVAPTNQPVPPLIDDPNRRIYRGLDPSLLPQDRVEVVTFAEPGTYLVVCGVLPHFEEGMHGFVRVLL